MKKNCDILIIGAGPAGLTAGLYAARAGFKTVIIENTVSGGAVNLTSEVANFPAHMKISGFDLGTKLLEQAEAAGAELVIDEIQTINYEKKTADCIENKISYKALIIAAGASPRKLGVPGEEEFWANGVHTCGLCDGLFFKDKDIVIIGGGNSAIEEAIYMSAIAKNITIVDFADKFIAQKVLIDKMQELRNVKKIYSAHKVLKIIGENKLSGIEIQSLKDDSPAKVLSCDGVFVSIGRAPNTALFKDKINLSKNGCIIVDGKLQTNIAGVFAAGDITDKQIRQIITACSDGAVAAINAAEYIKMFDKK